jgi:iron(III) transport system permease protein
MILLVIGKQIPYASRAGISAMFQPSKELEEAGELLGAGCFKRFRQIIWPLTRVGFSAGFLIVFITTMRELSLFILLVTSRTQVLTTLTFEYAEEEQTPAELRSYDHSGSTYPYYDRDLQAL